MARDKKGARDGERDRMPSKKGARDGERDRMPSKKAVPLGRPAGGLPTPAWIGIAVVCLVLGVALGHFVIGGGASGAAGGKIQGATTVKENQLDTPMGSYTYDGETHEVTVKDVIELSSTVDAAKNDDGTYTVPSASGVLSYAQREIFLAAAEKDGQLATDEEAEAYAKDQTGSDIATLASNYGVSEDSARELVVYYATQQKVLEKVTGAKTPDAPTEPDAPEEGKEDEATEYYATYIADLAGDEWDAEKKAWKDPSGDFATALANYDLSEGKATYEAAQSAYYVAYQKYTDASDTAAKKFGDYVNELMSHASVQLYTLVS